MPTKPVVKKPDTAAIARAASLPLPPVREPTARESLANKLYGTPLPKEVGLGGRRKRRGGVIDVSKLPPLPKSAPPSPDNSDDEEEKVVIKKRGDSPLAQRLYLNKIKTKKGGYRKRRKTRRRR